MKLNHAQLDENYLKYKNYFDGLVTEGNYFETQKKHVFINSTSTYVRNHELAHSIQMKKGSPFLLAHLFFKLKGPKLWLPTKFVNWLQTYATFYMELEACKMAIVMTKYVNKWSMDEATLARHCLLSYAKTRFQNKLVDQQDFN